MDDLIYRSAALKSLGEPPHKWPDNEYEIGLQVQWASDFNAIKSVPSAQQEQHEIGYFECANVMLKMWNDNILTNGEYKHIMDKLNTHWAERREE